MSAPALNWDVVGKILVEMALTSARNGNEAGVREAMAAAWRAGVSEEREATLGVLGARLNACKDADQLELVLDVIESVTAGGIGPGEHAPAEATTKQPAAPAATSERN